MPSHNLAQIKIGDLEIIGYSVAGEETVVAMPQLDVCFDIGKAPHQIISINHILLTHGHMDHAAGIAYYLSHRNFSGQSPGTILAPANLLGPIRDIIDAWSRLDGNKVPAKLVGVQAGDEYQIKPNLFTRVFPTKHSKGSVGYTVIEKRKKIKSEYAKLTGPQIVELKKQGIEIDYPLEIPIVTYLGDTQNVDFSQLNYIVKSKILIAECTFYETDHSGRAEAGRHMHINEFKELIDKLQNKHIVITHTTQRTPMREIRRILKEALPAEKYAKMILLMANRRR
ncbi:MAG: MBL fold metallo-hydrolase [Phycisphaerae bacterium]|nr:MBL fold metallo-hydrolase [Phycisphaerae bacterium]NIU09873.1 MBL fold metallo-hydrolase [Phycisphaerae bacterium]NIU56534.1 MBL fold metallo-hydrolase [Phycisphaerae bacterium]NIW79303.1 MBL fold metallo-hydrolase [Calditrichia bacterium]NIW96136.1 MBL fold metallo-hydrolase [Phycisphaerae bacterium]